MAEVRIHGLRELGERLLAFPRKLQWRILKVSTEAAAQVLQDEASRLAPRRTGRLSRSIGRRRMRPTPDREWFKVSVRKKTYYWWFQENGSARNPAHPYLRPAAANKSREAVEAFKARFREGIAQVLR